MSSFSSALPAPVRAYEVYNDGPVSRTAGASGGPSMPPPPSRHNSNNPTPSTSSSSSSSALTLYGSNATTTTVAGTSGGTGFDAIVLAQHKGKVVQTRFSDIVEKDASKVIKARPSADVEAEAAEKTRAALEAIVSHKIAGARPTAAALHAVAAGTNARPSSSSAEEASKLVRYVPDKNVAGYSAAASTTRVVKMVNAAVDPLEPPKFKHSKVPGGPPDAPVPILHSPPRKLTVEDQQAWDIPPAVSNWKNAGGYVLPLDVRVAADGRSLLEPTVNDGFARLAETLLMAERKARVEVDTRAAILRKSAQHEREQKEAALRAHAARARMERSGIADLPAESVSSSGQNKSSSSSSSSGSSSGGGGGRGAALVGFEGEELDEEGEGDGSNKNNNVNKRRLQSEAGVASSGLVGYTEGADGEEDEEDGDDEEDGGGGIAARPQVAGESEEDYKARLAREKMRREARKQREREIRAAANVGRRGNKATRDAERDVGERIALGMPTATGGGGGGGGEAMYDARLFNQSEGVGSGLGTEDSYNVYDKAWRGNDAAVAAAIYRPRGAGASGGPMSEADASAAVEGLRDGAAKRFRTAGEGGGGGGADFEGVSSRAPRPAGPVEFERAGSRDAQSGSSSSSSSSSGTGTTGGETTSDPFGLDAFLGGSGGGRKPNPLDVIGKGRGGGYMAASGGSSMMRGGGEGGARDGGSGRSSINFTSGGHITK